MSMVPDNPFVGRQIVRATGAFVTILLVLLYIGFQSRILLLGPQVVLTSDLEVVQNERFVTITGQAQNLVRITLNGRQIFTDEAGNFEEDVFLENGYTIVTIAAVDRYGRQTKVERSFVYTPASINEARAHEDIFNS